MGAAGALTASEALSYRTSMWQSKLKMTTAEFQITDSETANFSLGNLPTRTCSEVTKSLRGEKKPVLQHCPDSTTPNSRGLSSCEAGLCSPSSHTGLGWSGWFPCEHHSNPFSFQLLRGLLRLVIGHYNEQPQNAQIKKASSNEPILSLAKP